VRCTESRLREIIREALSLNRTNCSPYTHSLAWIEPSGKVHILKPKETHNEWMTMRSFYDRWSKGDRNISWSDYALENGWVRVTNGTMFEIFGSIDVASDGTIQGIIEILLGCASALKSDPENTRVYFEQRKKLPDGTISFLGRDYVDTTIADFVQRYGTEADAEKLYGISPIGIRESVSKSSCSPNSYSLAWISPEGKTFFLKPGEEHGKWAEGYTGNLYDRMEIDYRRLDSDEEYADLVDKYYDWKTDSWSEEYLKSNKEAAAWLEANEEPAGWLLKNGWVKMTNGFTFAAHPVDSLDSRAVSAIIDVVVSCAIESGIDPEKQKMFIEEYSKDGLVPSDKFLTPEYSRRLRGGSGYFGSQHLIGADSVSQPLVADFVEMYGTEADAERLYSAL
jgi:hypothetical protein